MSAGKQEKDFTDLERLIKAAKAGDKSAKEKLIFAFRPMIFAAIQKYVYDRQDHEDAYQDAVCVFLTAVQDFELEGRVYFQVFARSRLTNYFKKRREGRFSPSVTADESLDRQVAGEAGAIALIELILDEKTDVEGVCLQKEHNKACVVAFRKLTPWQQEVLSCQYRGRGYMRALARRHGMSPAAVTQACDRAVERMKAALK